MRITFASVSAAIWDSGKILRDIIILTDNCETWFSINTKYVKQRCALGRTAGTKLMANAILIVNWLSFWYFELQLRSLFYRYVRSHQKKNEDLRRKYLSMPGKLIQFFMCRYEYPSRRISNWAQLNAGSEWLLGEPTNMTKPLSCTKWLYNIAFIDGLLQNCCSCSIALSHRYYIW